LSDVTFSVASEDTHNSLWLSGAGHVQNAFPACLPGLPLLIDAYSESLLPSRAVFQPPGSLLEVVTNILQPACTVV